MDECQAEKEKEINNMILQAEFRLAKRIRLQYAFQGKLHPGYGVPTEHPQRSDSSEVWRQSLSAGNSMGDSIIDCCANLRNHAGNSAHHFGRLLKSLN